ncbi:MAG: biotin/lipoyl-binding protein [Lachnospiraceae bacterium]|nr:biotin/lipoyl-binding protein [Lachnospiraceae bacterium]
MKSYTITVNGVAYDVTVEENTSVSVPVRTQKPAPAGSPKAASKIPTAGGGSVKISAGAAGKVYKIEKEAGASVKKGDTVVVIEAMKMEIPIVAPKNGTVVSIDVSVGDSVEAGQALATMD